MDIYTPLNPPLLRGEYFFDPNKVPIVKEGIRWIFFNTEIKWKFITTLN